MKRHFIRTRKVRYAVMASVLTLLVITVAVLANATFGTLAKRYTWYTPMQSALSYDVTEKCYDILGDAFAASPDKKTEIIFCDTPENLVEEVTGKYLYETATSLAERFPEALTVNCYDIWINPNTVRKYTAMTNPITGEEMTTALKSTSVIIVSGDYHRVYSLEEFYVFRGGDSSQVWGYNGERKLAAGILRAIATEEHVVCLTQNHGEIYYDYELLYLLDDAGYTIKYLDLYKDDIPENCEMIISYNPNSDLVSSDDTLSDKPSETDKLDAFLSVPGNSYWVLVENGTPSLPKTEAYLAEWGVELCYDPTETYRHMVQDTSQSLTSDGYTIYGEPVMTGHSAELLEGLDRKVVFKNATAVRPADGFASSGDGSYTKGDRTLYSLYTGGSGAVAWANGKPLPGGERAILMSMTAQSNAGGSSYVGVVTSADFFSEEFLQSAVYGNTDAFMRAFANMGREHLPEGLTLKPFQSTDISTVTTAQMLWWTVGLALTPAVAVTAVAVAVLVKRRNA